MNVEKGDQVILYQGTRTLPRIYTIERITPSGQIILHDYPFRFYADGKELGRRIWGPYLEEVTPENLEKMRQEINRRNQNFYAERVPNALQRYVGELTIDERAALCAQLGIDIPERPAEVISVNGNAASSLT